MTQPILIGIALVSLVCNVIGIGLSLWLIAQAFGDRRALQIVRVNSYRAAIVRYTIEAETGRMLIHTIQLVVRIPGLLVATDRYSPIINDLWPLVLLSSVGTAAISAICAATSLRSLLMRNYVLSGSVVGPNDAPRRRRDDPKEAG